MSGMSGPAATLRAYGPAAPLRAYGPAAPLRALPHAVEVRTTTNRAVNNGQTAWASSGFG